MSQPTQLFEQLGGVEAIAEIVNDMYRRILADPKLAPFFEKTPLERLRHMQYEFLVSAFDGPVTYSGSELTAVHKGRGIRAQHFYRFCGHFADAMEARGIDPLLIDRALGRLALYRDRITGDSNVDG